MLRTGISLGVTEVIPMAEVEPPRNGVDYCCFNEPFTDPLCDSHLL